MLTHPESRFKGTLVFLAPHMDDEVLACGGTIASFVDKERLHVAYATDGSKSPVPVLRRNGTRSKDLSKIRRAEAQAALDVLGVPKQNIHFLGYPDGELSQHVPALLESVKQLIDCLSPAYLFIPFRYDRHPDHLALHQSVLAALPLSNCSVQIVEYFVYYRWRLLPGGDVRRLVRSEYLLQVDIQKQRKQKRNALKCYESQTTVYFNWQNRPILPPKRVEEVSRAPEFFLLSNPYLPGAAVFSRLRLWIPMVHWLEPGLKQRKDRIALIVRSIR